MVDTTKITAGIIGVLIFGGLGAYLLTPDQLAKSYTCTKNNVTGIFEKFSNTNVTGYWTVNGTIKQAVCSKGKWIPTIEWLKLYGLSEKDITINPVNESDYTENDIEIITVNKIIMVNQTKQISINGELYNITYVPKTVIKCICDKTSGCKIRECLT
jgi:hypothetical protein